MPKKANIFESFSHSAIQQFKEAFGIMDTDKDGLLSASDLVAAFGAHGKSIGSGDAQVGVIISSSCLCPVSGLLATSEKLSKIMLAYILLWESFENCVSIRCLLGLLCEVSLISDSRRKQRQGGGRGQGEGAADTLLYF